jgi:hypothetical protein
VVVITLGKGSSVVVVTSYKVLVPMMVGSYVV